MEEGRGLKAGVIVYDEMCYKQPEVEEEKLNPNAPEGMKTFVFKDKNGTIQGYLLARFSLNEKGEFICLFGTLMTVDSWSLKNVPSESKFMANVYFKWDACTHWHFYGEDSDGDADHNVPYYHLCGTGLVRFVRFMQLTTHIVKQQPGAYIHDTEYIFDCLNVSDALNIYDVAEYNGVPHWVDDTAIQVANKK